MLKNITVVAFVFALLSSPAFAKSVGGVEFPETVTVGGSELVFNGAGLRKKLFIKLYAAGLYLESPSTEGTSIIADDKTQSLSLTIISGLISSEKMEDAVVEGFQHSASNNLPALQTRIDKFITVLREEIKKKDQFAFNYLPGSGTRIMKNGSEKAVIEGLDFKSALFGIWLSKKPAQKSLKEELLGK